MKAKNNSKKCFLFFVPFICVCCLICLAIHSVIPRQYITTSIDDYGVYTGNYDNDFPEEFISSFFPDEIEANFKNVSYSYRAQKSDTYAFEAFLEFEIEDENQYQNFVDTVSTNRVATEFPYDTSFIQYVVSDEFVPTVFDGKSQTDPYVVNIRFAEIGKILCSDKDNKIIFVAIGVYDGGVVKTDFLNVYFDKFEINPSEYNQSAE